MRRRTFLRAGGGSCLGLTLGAAAAVSAPATATDDEADAFEPLGVVDVRGAAEAVVGDEGETTYLAATDGFATVDVSDPTDPTVLAERRDLTVDDRPLTEILDVKVDGDRLVVPGPANPAGAEEFYGFVLYDVSDPADPVVVGEPHETGYHIHNCYLDGDVLYLVANGIEAERDGDVVEDNPLVVFDVADDEPEEVGRWSLLEFEPDWADVGWRLRYLHDVYVHDGVAILAHWNAGTYLLDVSDPADLRYRSHVADSSLEDQLALDADEEGDAYTGLPGNDHYSAVDETGELLAVGRESWATESGEPEGAGGIDLFDVRDPDEPDYRATIEPPETDDASYQGGEWTTAHNFELHDGRLHSSWYQGGVRVHDVSDPAEPVELAGWEDRDAAGFWTARVADDGTIVASSTPLIPNASTEGALYTFPADIEGDASGQGQAATVDRVAGATALATVAGGTLALEWGRRRAREE